MVPAAHGPEQKLDETPKFQDYIAGKNIEQVDREVATAGLLPANQEYQQSKLKEQELTLETDRLLAGGLMKAHPKIVGLNNQLQELEDFLAILRKQRVTQLEEQKTELLQTLDFTKSDAEAWNAKVVENLRLKGEYDKLNDNLAMNQNIF